MVRHGRVNVTGLALAAAVAFCLSACSSSPGSSAASTGSSSSSSGSPAVSGKPVNIAFLGYTSSGFTDAIVSGAKSVVAPGGGSVTYFSADFDPQKQDSQCKDAITSGRYQAFILDPVDPTASLPCVRAAAAAHIPVATVETAVGSDPYSLVPQVAGVVAVANTTLQEQVSADGELILGACGSANPCKVIPEVASATDRWTNDLVNGLSKALAPKVQFVNKIETFYDPGTMAKLLPDVLTAHPDANVLFSVSDQTALTAVNVIAAKNLSGQIKVVGLGGTKEGAAAIASGTLYGSTGNWPIQNGAFLATALAEAANSQPVKNSSQDMLKTDTPLILTKDTVSTFKPEW